MEGEGMTENQGDRLVWGRSTEYGWTATDTIDGSSWALSSCGDGQGGRVVPLYHGAKLVGVFANSKAARERAEKLRKGVEA
jgi:hypothetical protein